MIQCNHISSGQLAGMVGDELGLNLWLNGMMNELRRYPNEIPCNEGEIPSMRIPFASGEEKADWGFLAGMSCLVPNADGSIRVRNAAHFPACAVLALLSLLHEAGVPDRKDLFSVTLEIPEGEGLKDFKDLLTQAEQKLDTVKIIRRTLPAEAAETAAARTLSPSSGDLLHVLEISRTDLGRYAAKVRLVSGSVRVGDDLTVTTGSFDVLLEHCPVTQLVSMANQPVKSSDELSEDTFFLCFAAYFPPERTSFAGLLLIREAAAPAFTPRKMPPRPVFSAAQKPKGSEKKDASGGILQKLGGLFGKKASGAKRKNSASQPAAVFQPGVDIELSFESIQGSARGKSVHIGSRRFYHAADSTVYTEMWGTGRKDKLTKGRVIPDEVEKTKEAILDFLNGRPPAGGGDGKPVGPPLLYCARCGTALPDYTAVCPKCGAARKVPGPEETVRFCKRCGACVPMSAAYCVYCGVFLGIDVRSVPSPEPEPNAAAAAENAAPAVCDAPTAEPPFRKIPFEDFIDASGLDGIEGWRVYHFYQLQAGRPVEDAVAQFLRERPDLRSCETDEWLRRFRGYPTYLLVGSEQDVCLLCARNARLVNACREGNIHLIGGNSTRFWDCFDNAPYSVFVTEYPGSADDAATYGYVKLSRIPLPPPLP